MNILIPVGVGELYDKISILEIKSEKIKDEAKLANVHKELALLKEKTAGTHVDATVYAELKKVNEGLWDVETAIRAEEAGKSFGEEFIKLARSVYELNDRRAELKRKINLDAGSDIIEEKHYTKS